MTEDILVTLISMMRTETLMTNTATRTAADTSLG